MFVYCTVYTVNLYYFEHKYVDGSVSSQITTALYFYADLISR